MKADIERLRALAGRSHSGPWSVEEDPRPGMQWNRHIARESGLLTVCFMAHADGKDDDRDEATASLIAACDPQTVLALCAAASEAEALRVDAERWRWARPILSADDTMEANTRTLALGAGLMQGREVEAIIDSAIAASKPATEAKP